MILKLSILLFLTIAFIIWRAFWDNSQIKEGDSIDHLNNAIASIACGNALSLLVLSNLSYVPLFLSIYWLLFDLLLNKLRGKDILYVGTTAWLDKSFRKISPEHSGIAMLIVKIICLGISLWGLFNLNKLKPFGV